MAMLELKTQLDNVAFPSVPSMEGGERATAGLENASSYQTETGLGNQQTRASLRYDAISFPRESKSRGIIILGGAS